MNRIAFFLSILILATCNVISQSNQAKKVEPLKIGEPMPDFNLPGIDGINYTQDNFSEYDILVVIFTCNHCPTAQAYEERIKKLYNDYHPKNVGFVTISPNSNEALSLAECGYSDLDDSFESMKIRAQDIGLEFPYLYDGETSETSLKFGPVATPHVFIFDKRRVLRYRGRIDDMESPYEKPTSRDTRNALEALVNGNPVEVETTKTFGCSVKWPWKDEWTKQLIERWAEEEVNLLEVGKTKLQTLLNNETDNLILLNIWATYCGPCVIEYPYLVDTYRMYNGRDFNFVSLSMDKASHSRRALTFLDEMQSSNTNFIWSGGSPYDAIDIIGNNWQGSLPFTMLIKPGGEVIYSYEGPVDILVLRKKIIEELGRYFADDK